MRVAGARANHDQEEELADRNRGYDDARIHRYLRNCIDSGTPL